VTRQHLSAICPDASAGKDVRSLSDFFAIIKSCQRSGNLWFRGNSDSGWTLTPGALRSDKLAKRQKALSILDEFRVIAQPKLSAHPTGDTDSVTLEWMQIAAHYGIPTRLLDWTENSGISLYFACAHADGDGAVFILDPLNLNGTSSIGRRVLNPVSDLQIIKKYVALNGRIDRRGPETVALQPIQNNERIRAQHGRFTIHGSRHRHLDQRQCPGLSYLFIPRDAKFDLLRELETISINEMHVFPELEHTANYLKSQL